MSEGIPEPTPGTPTPVSQPSLFRELLALGKLILGVGLIALGGWRIFVWAFGPDESLLFAYRVKAKHDADEAAAQKQYEKGLRELKLGRRTPEEIARERERLDRELSQVLEGQPERDRERYRAERWLELIMALFCIAVGPGLVWAGKSGVQWPRRRDGPSVMGR